MPQLQLKGYSKIHDKAFFSNWQFSNLFFWLQVSADMQNMLQSMRSEITMEQNLGNSVSKGTARESGGELISIVLR